MKTVTQQQASLVSGGDHQLTVVISAPSNSTGFGVSNFVGNLVNGRIIRTNELIHYWDFFRTIYPHAPLTKITSIEYI